jgi:hypothetical protein
MNACQTVSKWISENILVPVERVITEARESCENIGAWVEEEVWQPVSLWLCKFQTQCGKQDCVWWCLCCNKWFCWLVAIVVEIVVWVVVTVVKWVVTVVCQIITVVVGIVVDLVLKIITRLVACVVCIFIDPLQALKTLWDLWNDIVGAVAEILDLVALLVNDVIGILADVDTLLGVLGKSFCIFGDGACAIFGAIFGFFRGVIHWVADILDWVRDVIIGIKDLVVGILTLNWCRIQKALGILSVFRAILSGTRILGELFYSGPASEISQNTLERIISSALESMFRDDPQRLARSKFRARLGSSPIGIPVRIDARRLAIRSSDFLRQLHADGVLNLHAVGGRVSDCQGKFVYDQFDGEVVYTGTETGVSQSDLDLFLSAGPDAVPSFTAYPIKLDAYRRLLEIARKKGFQIGLNFTWHSITDVVISDRQYIPLDTGENNDALKNLLTLIGRPQKNEDLSTVPVIAVFGFRNASLHGWTREYRPASEPPQLSPSGVAFRIRFPEWGFRFVPIHEIGHYFGLDHPGHDSLRYIMYSPKENANDWGKTVGEFGFLSGEANFTEKDAQDAWRWITATPQTRDSFLP